jgi:hypothetical protein
MQILPFQTRIKELMESQGSFVINNLPPEFFTSLDAIFRDLLRTETNSQTPTTTSSQDSNLVNIARAYCDISDQIENSSVKKVVFALGASYNDDLNVINTIQSIYNTEVEYYKAQGWETHELTQMFTELVKSNPSEEQWETYNTQVELYQSKGWKTDKLTKMFTELVKSNPSEEQWKTYNTQVEYYIAQGWMTDYLTPVFIQLVNSNPSEEQWKTYNTQVEYYKSQSWGTDYLTQAFTELVKSNPNEEQWKTYNTQVEYYKSQGWKTGELTKMFTELVKMNLKLSQEELEARIKTYNTQVEYYKSQGWGTDYLTGELTKMFLKLVKIDKTNHFQNLIEIGSLVRSINASTDHQEAKLWNIDTWLGENYNALINLVVKYPNINKFLLSQFKNRRNPNLFTGEISVFNNLSERDLGILDDIYANKKPFYQNDQRNLIKLARYLVALNESQIDLQNVEPGAIFKSMAEKLIDLLKEKFQIRINEEQFNLDEFERTWDLDNFGTLVAAVSQWEAQDKEVFKTLVQAGFDDKLASLFSEQVDEFADGTTRTIQAAFKTLKSEMEAKSLDFDKWQNAHTTIESVMATKDSNTSAPSYLELFGSFKEFIELENITIENIDNFNKQTLTPAARKDLEQKIQALISDKYQVGNIPEAISDLLNYLTQKVDNRSNQSVSFADPMDLGHNLFVGNRANSCIALGANAKAILYLLSDPGTKYLLVKNSEDKITGYARVFLTLDKDDKPKIFIDSVDGSAHGFMGAIKKQLEKLAKAVGIEQTDFEFNRGLDNAKTKLGSSAFPESYLHHADNMRI